MGSRLGQLAWGLGAATFVAGACGNKDDNPVLPSSSGDFAAGGKSPAFGGAGRGGRAGSGGEAGGMAAGSAGVGVAGGGEEAGAGATVNPAAPVVTIASPAAESDPNGTGVIVAEQVDVLCTATRSTHAGSAPVDPATVTIAMLDAGGNMIESVAGSATDNVNEYKGTFVTTKVTDNGPISFTCTAGDTASPPLVGMGRVDTFVDHGPDVTIGDPADMSDVGLMGAVHVDFQVAADPVAKGDKAAAVASVTFTVNGVMFDLAEKDGTYTTSVNLADKTLFPTTPDGNTQVEIIATDERKPTAAVRDVTYNFVTDGTGPVITILQPDGKTPRGGSVDLQFTAVDDQSGVDPSTIVVYLNDDPNRYDPKSKTWTHDGDTYTFTFDTTQLTSSKVKANIRVSASDLVGNPGNDATILLNLDNVAPIVDLDPAPIRETNSTYCSVAFDPVGPRAASDLQVVQKLQLVRALAWDRTNTAPGMTVAYYSVVDLNSVYLFIQPNVEDGLIYDQDKDGICDSIQETDPVTNKPLLSQHLTPIPPAGAPWYGSMSNEDSTLDTDFPMPDGCTYQGGNVPEPPTLCQPYGSDMTQVIPWDYDHTVPAIFALGPLSGAACTGTDWEFTDIQEGWICIAGRASDNTGNVGISVPLRLCYDDGVDPPPTCADPVADPPPSCIVDGCTLPPRFESGLYKQ
ncbi:MAG TPA: hypothetical protein VMI54_15980 [Polyangiaceae bacterium]|nr:hypothetical protein [Polyangiaceae bacterium]